MGAVLKRLARANVNNTATKLYTATGVTTQISKVTIVMEGQPSGEDDSQNVHVKIYHCDGGGAQSASTIIYDKVHYGATHATTNFVAGFNGNPCDEVLVGIILNVGDELWARTDQPCNFTLYGIEIS